MGKDISQLDWILNTTEVMIKEIDSSISIEKILTNNNSKLLYISNIPEKKMSEITLLTNTDNNNNYLYLENINLYISYSKDPITVPGLVDIFIDIFRYSDNDAFLKNNSIHKPFSSENLGSTFSEFITKLLDTIPNGYKYNKITGSRKYSIILNPDPPVNSKINPYINDNTSGNTTGNTSGNTTGNTTGSPYPDTGNSYKQSPNQATNRLTLQTINQTIQDFNNKLNDKVGVENNPLNDEAEDINEVYQFYLRVMNIKRLAIILYNQVMARYFLYMIRLSTLDYAITVVILEDLQLFYDNPIVDGVVKLGEIISDNLSRFAAQIKTPGLVKKVDRYNETFRAWKDSGFQDWNKGLAFFQASNDLTGFTTVTKKLGELFDFSTYITGGLLKS